MVQNPSPWPGLFIKREPMMHSDLQCGNAQAQEQQRLVTRCLADPGWGGKGLQAPCEDGRKPAWIPIIVSRYRGILLKIAIEYQGNNAWWQRNGWRKKMP